MMNTKHTSVQAWIDAVSLGHTQERAFYYLCNKDKTIRWIWPADNKKPVFLKFYTTSTLKSRAFAALVKLVFLLRLQSLFAKKELANFDFFPTENNIDTTREWAMFTGTQGPNRKLVVAASDFNNEFSFTKIAFGENAARLIQNEKKSIKTLSQHRLKQTSVPRKMSHSSTHLQISDVSSAERSNKLSTPHINTLGELSQLTNSSQILGNTTAYKLAMDNYRELNACSDDRLPKAMKRKLQWLINSLDEQKKIETVTAHGDFTPWNCFVAKNKLAIYDLEMVQEQMPLGYDALHFVIQTGILVNRDSWKVICEEIMTTVCPTIFAGDKSKTIEYLKLYLLINTTYYLDVYRQQDEWHTQVNWLLQTWNEAISYVLQDTNDARKLVLMDTFDFMQNKKYAALKFKGFLPEQVSSLSDVDFCTDKKDAKELVKFLKNHCLVNIARIKNLSFMKNIELVLNNSELLSVDCIWELKRKNLVIADINQLLNSTTANVFGVKQPSSLVEADYVNHFYALNKAETPAPFRSKSFELEMEKLAKSTKPIAIQKALQGSLLPILSAWTLGKEAAEQKAASKLPRQGENKSNLSSLLRFSYYYTDYVVGQFYVYIKYVMRGKVVLYDRYYFDFINDSKRSNINLPTWVTTLGYKLVMKPHLNFFLYADAETILARKQELDAETITTLTKKYLDLFKKLNKQDKSKAYVPIKNIDLNTTVNAIMEKLKVQAA